MRPIELATSKLEGVREASPGQYIAHCPCESHGQGRGDRNRSLSFSEGDDGRLLVYCHGGCETESVLTSLGHDWGDTFAANGNGQGPTPSPRKRTPVPNLPSEAELGRLHDALMASPALLARLWELRRWTSEALRAARAGFDGERIVFPLRDAKGALIGVARFAPNPSTRGKAPKMVSDAGSRRGLLFGPESYAQGEPLVLVEGEPDAITARSAGLNAVGVGGVGAWSDAQAERFAGREVTVLFDCDRAGREAAEKVAKTLLPHAKTVRAFDLDETREDGWDLTDRLRLANTPDALKERGVELAAETLRQPPLAVPKVSKATSEARRVKLTTAAEVRPERISWAWRGRVPFGSLTLCAGQPKLGKSTLALDLAAKLSKGSAEGDAEGPVDSLILSFEDHIAGTLVPRLIAANADLERVHFIDSAVELADGGADLLSLTGDLLAIARKVEETGARLLVIDPLMAGLSAETNSHRDQDVRRALAPLAHLAEEADLAILIVAHLNKREGGGLITRIGASVGITGAARSILVMGADPDDPEGEDGPGRVLGQRGNLAGHVSSLLYRLEGVQIERNGERFETSRLELIGETDTRADELLESRGPGEDQADAEDWLAAHLADGAPKPSREVKKLGKRELGVSGRTLERALKRLGGEIERSGFPAQTTWRIDPSASRDTPLVATANETPCRDCENGLGMRDSGVLGSQSRQSPAIVATGANTPLATPEEEARAERLGMAPYDDSQGLAG